MPRVRLHVDDVRAHARRAIREGGRAKPTSVEVDYAGRCESPVFVTLEGRPEGGYAFKTDELGSIHARPQRMAHIDGLPIWKAAGISGARNPMWVDMWVKCRKCPACLKLRAREWAYRAKAELAAAPRTWFCTFTLSPAEHHRVQLLATQRQARAGTDFETLSAEQRFKARVDVVTQELTRWLKRVRKESGATLRYVLVAEAHKSGLPHFHALLHERAGTVTARTLSGQWKLGFSKFKLVPPDQPGVAWYVCKYLSKSALSRVRASVRYGK